MIFVGPVSFALTTRRPRHNLVRRKEKAGDAATSAGQVNVLLQGTRDE